MLKYLSESVFGISALSRMEANPKSEKKEYSYQHLVLEVISIEYPRHRSKNN